jgi:hypothetical protein
MMRTIDWKAKRVLAAIRRKIKRCTLKHLSTATKLSDYVVRRRCEALVDAGLAQQWWLGICGPYFDVSLDSEVSP